MESAQSTTTGGQPHGTGPVAIWSALSAVYVLWGSTYLGIAVVVSGAPPLLSAGARFFAAGVIVAVVLVLRRGFRSLVITRRELAGTALIALLLLTLGNGGVSLASQYVPSSVSALIVATVPLWVVCLRALSRDRPSALTWIGIACGFIGVAALVWSLGRDDPDPGAGYINLPGWQVGLWLLVVVVGSFSWAYGSFISPRVVQSGWAPKEPIRLVTWQFLVAGVALACGGFVHGESANALVHADARTYAVWAYIVVAGVIAYSCYTWLLQHTSISLASTYAYVNPLVALVLGAVFLAEPMTTSVLGSAVLIVAGVVLVVRAEAGSRRGRVGEVAEVSGDAEVLGGAEVEAESPR